MNTSCSERGGIRGEGEFVATPSLQLLIKRILFLWNPEVQYFRTLP
jgi:hypothetical protein